MAKQSGEGMIKDLILLNGNNWFFVDNFGATYSSFYLK